MHAKQAMQFAARQHFLQVLPFDPLPPALSPIPPPHHFGTEVVKMSISKNKNIKHTCTKLIYTNTFTQLKRMGLS